MQTRYLVWALPLSAVILLVLVPRVAPGQYQAQTVAVAGGPTTPRASFGDTVRAGFHVTAGVGFNFGERFSLRMEGMYQQLGNRVASGKDHQMVGFATSAEIDVRGASGPYVVGGYGFYQTLKLGTVPASAWEGGYNIGGGWRFVFPRLALFGEARVHRIRGPGRPAMVPISLGLRI